MYTKWQHKPHLYLHTVRQKEGKRDGWGKVQYTSFKHFLLLNKWINATQSVFLFMAKQSMPALFVSLILDKREGGSRLHSCCRHCCFFSIYLLFFWGGVQYFQPPSVFFFFFFLSTTLVCTTIIYTLWYHLWPVWKRWQTSKSHTHRHSYTHTLTHTHKRYTCSGLSLTALLCLHADTTPGPVLSINRIMMGKNDWGKILRAKGSWWRWKRVRLTMC